MKQIIQDLKSGETVLEEIPVPQVKSGSVLIKTTRSLVSLGTERMLVEFGKANLIDKARQQPDRVKQVLDKFKTDGIMPTLEAVFNKLGQPLPLGYCNVGINPRMTGFFQNDDCRATTVETLRGSSHEHFIRISMDLPQIFLR